MKIIFASQEAQIILQNDKQSPKTTPADVKAADSLAKILVQLVLTTYEDNLYTRADDTIVVVSSWKKDLLAGVATILIKAKADGSWPEEANKR